MKENKLTKSSTFIIIGLVAALIIGTIVYAGNKEPVSDLKSDTETKVISEQINKQTAPNFILERVGGGTIELASYKGQKPVILDFFATWCPNCKRDMPRLNSFYEKYKDKVEVIGIDLQEQSSIVEKFTNDLNLTFPIVLDKQGKVAKQYGVRYTNFHILIDKDGNIIGTVPGDISEDDFLKFISS